MGIAGLVFLAVLVFVILCFVVGLAVVSNTDTPKPISHPHADPIQEIHRIGFEAHQAIDRASNDYLREVQDLMNDSTRR